MRGGPWMWGDSPVAPRSLARTLLQKSHVISLGQFLICPENVGIATTRFQSLKDVLGNYVRHLWGTIRVRVGGGRCAGASGCGCVVCRGRPRVGRGQPFLPENSHVIYLGQFLMCRENVGIATTRFQSLKDGSGNYVRHFWGTMRVCGCVVCRGRRGACRAWPGFEIDHSEPKARVWRSRGRAGPARASGVGEVGLRPAGQAAGKAGPASVGTRGLARSRDVATPRSASRSRARTAPGRFPASRAR